MNVLCWLFYTAVLDVDVVNVGFYFLNNCHSVVSLFHGYHWLPAVGCLIGDWLVIDWFVSCVSCQTHDRSSERAACLSRRKLRTISTCWESTQKGELLLFLIPPQFSLDPFPLKTSHLPLRSFRINTFCLLAECRKTQQMQVNIRLYTGA